MRITDIVYINIIKNISRDLFDNFITFWKEPFNDKNDTVIGVCTLHIIAFTYIQFKMITTVGWPVKVIIGWPTDPAAQMACIGVYVIMLLLLGLISTTEIFGISKIINAICSYKESYISRYGNPFDKDTEEYDTVKHKYTWSD